VCVKKIFRPRNLFLAFAALIFGWFATFAYHMNYVCGPDEHTIRSNADAIEQAQRRMYKAHYGMHGIPGYIDEKPGTADFSRPDCCEVEKTITLNGVIVWEVGLVGETIGEQKKRRVSALIRLSNCGAVFDEDSYIVAEPIN
jgi:hypothetical protein